MKNIISALPKFFTPGPTEVHPKVSKVISETKIYHRSPEFRSLYNSLIASLKKVIQTKYYVLVLTSSGTGAMESAVINFCDADKKVLFINQGRFGLRWGNICRAHGITADEVRIEYGCSANETHLFKSELNRYSAIFLTHVETSTATLTDLKLLIEYIKYRTDALIIVDAISSIGTIPFFMDEWGVDVSLSASQKGFMCPPGISVVALNNKAFSKINKNSAKFYFDFQREVSAASDGNTTWTPAVNLFAGLNFSCNLILQEGIENRWQRIINIAEDFRIKCSELGFGLFSKYPSDSLTALTLPEGKGTTDFIQTIKDKYGLLIANGQSDLKNKILRVSHMGYLEKSDFDKLIEILKYEIAFI